MSAKVIARLRQAQVVSGMISVITARGFSFQTPKHPSGGCHNVPSNN
jgi:hypothetical protein